MTSTVAWLETLKRLQRRALNRSPLGTRVAVLARPALVPGPRWNRPELRSHEQRRKVEFELHLPGVTAGDARIHWDEEARTLTLAAIAERSTSGPLASDSNTDDAHEWYAEIALDGDCDGSRAAAFLNDGTLRITVPRADSQPLTGLPVLVSPLNQSDWSLALAT